MCEFCVKHGEGKKWYLNAKNYSNDLLSDIKRRNLVRDFFFWSEKTYKRYIPILEILPFNTPLIGAPLRAITKVIFKHIFINNHWGQVVPIEDAESILAMTNSIVRIPCICRKIVKNKEIRTCFLISLSLETKGMAGIIDDSYFGGPDVRRFESWDKTKALNFIKEQEKEGIFHSIWTFGTPFIGGICNCDNTSCIAFKAYKKSAPIFFRAEYIIKADKDKCTGCQACIKICPFNALSYDAANKKVSVNEKKCYGCGICRSVCKYDALELVDRSDNRVTEKLWY